MAKKHINEEQLRKIVKESVLSAMQNMRDAANNAGMNIKNPADDYEVNFDEFNQKCQELYNILASYEEYFGGNTEDGDKYVRGFASTLRLKSMWNRNQKQMAFAEKVKEIGDLVHNLKFSIEQIMEECDNLQYDDED